MPDYGFIANSGASPLDTVSKFATLQNTINQNRLFQGQVAAGQALQQATDPATGQIDFGRAQAILRANPATAPYALEAMNKLLQGQGQSIVNTTGQVSLQAARTKNLRQVIASVPPGPNQDTQILTAVARGAAAGLYPADMAATLLGGGQLADGTSLKDLARESAIANGDASAMEAQFGTPETVNTGGRNQAFTVNRVTNERAPMGGDAGAVPMTLTPGEKAQRVGIVQGGVPETAPVSALTTDTGEPKPSPLTGPQGQTQSALTPAQQAGGTTSGTGNANMALTLQTRASRVNDNKALLGNMEGLIGEMNATQLGPQSQFWKHMGQLAAEYNVPLPFAPPTNKTQAQEEFSKLAFQLAQSQFQALGGTGTDSKLDSTMHTSPSEFLTRYGNKGIIALLKGNEDAVAAQYDAWQKWQGAGHGPETYGQFLGQWNKIYDPRVFQSQYMTGAERQTMLKGMTSAEATRFKADYKRAVKLGWVQ